MIDEILHHFPEDGGPLFVVSDPDGLLGGEELLAALYGRGFTVIEEPDPVRLRWRVLEFGPNIARQPLIVVSEGPLEQMPYDLWQQGEHVNLSLPRFFPNLAYPVLQSLSSEQRARLAHIPQPPRLLGQQNSIDYLLQHLFGVNLAQWQQPGAFIAWLDALHAGSEQPLPLPFIGRLVQQLQNMPTEAGTAPYHEWPLRAMLVSAEQFRHFLDSQWRAYVSRETGHTLGEPPPRYVLPFESNEQLQDTLPRLLRSGSLQRVSMDDPERLPAWARPAVAAPDEDVAQRRQAELLELLAEQATALESASWAQWQLVARTWAELSTLVHGAPGARPAAYGQWQAQLDQAFLAWLEQRYAPLGARRLPTPHHLFHVPEYLAWERNRHEYPPVALIILDGMSLADWLLIRQRWQQRHPGWQFQEQLLLAQIPSITPVSRQALVSGERPAAFRDRLTDNSREGQQWAAFWARNDVPTSASLYGRLHLRGVNGAQASWPDDLGSTRLQAACLINNSIDDLSHGARLGAADMQASLEIWLRDRSPALERLIDQLLARRFLVYLCSDHGHTEAQGMGNPREGQIAETRGLRARVYRDRALAEEVRAAYPDTILWQSHGLLPDDAYVLMPHGRKAFTQEGEAVVTHGGLTLDEMVAPLVRVEDVG